MDWFILAQRVYYYPRPPLCRAKMSVASHSSHSSVIQLILGRGLMLSRGKGVWGSIITTASGREPQTPFPRDSINPPIIPLSFCHSLLISVIPVSFKSFHGQSRAKFVFEFLNEDGMMAEWQTSQNSFFSPSPKTPSFHLIPSFHIIFE